MEHMQIEKQLVDFQQTYRGVVGHYAKQQQALSKGFLNHAQRGDFK